MEKSQIIEAIEIIGTLKQYGYQSVKEKGAKLDNLLTPILEGMLKKEERKQAKYSVDQFNPLTEARAIHDRLKTAKTLSIREGQSIHKEDRKTQDILHFLELNELEDEETLKIANMLKENRVQRRKAKDFIDLTDMLNEIHTKYPGLMNDLEVISQKIEKEIEQKETRKYTPKEINLEEKDV